MHPYNYILLTELGRDEFLKIKRERVQPFKIDLNKLKVFLLMEFPDAFDSRRKRNIVIERQAICHILLSHKRYIGITLTDIAKLFNQNHSTVICAGRVVDNWFEVNGYEKEQKEYERINFILKTYLKMELKNGKSKI
jgi:hypothetical protein